MRSKTTGLIKALALASILCFASIGSAQDLMAQIQAGQELYDFGDNQAGRARVSSLPSEVLATETKYEESSDDHRADFLVFLGIAGVFVAGVSATSLLWIVRKRSERHGPVPLVGVVRATN